MKGGHQQQHAAAATAGWKIRRVLCLIALHFVSPCSGQERPLYDTATWARNVSHRTDFCPIHKLVEDGTILRRNVLLDVDIAPALFRYQLNKETSAIDEVNPGLGIVFLDELARRGKFEWRNSYGVVDSPGENQTWSELLDWSVDTYDVVGDWFLRTIERLGDGILFPEGWYDGSLIMVKRGEEEESGFVWSSFLEPFSPEVWLLIAATAVVSGLLFWVLEYFDDLEEAVKRKIGISECIFNASYGLTGHCVYTPRSPATRIAAFSTAFLFLLVMTAYTANLTSFLIIQNQPSLVINDIQDAIKNDLRFCVLRSSTSENYLTREYETARIVRLDSIGDTYLAVDRGECDIVLTTVSTWELNRRDITYNRDCKKQWVGRVVSFTTAGFTIRDSANLCTSLLRDVLSLHLLEMKIDGTFDTIWDTHREKSATNNCLVETAEDEDGRLTVKQVGGIFIFHLFALIIALGTSLLPVVRRSLSNSPPKSDSVSNQSPTTEHEMALRSSGSPHSQDSLEAGAASSGDDGCDGEVSSQLQKLRSEMNDQVESMHQRDSKHMEAIGTVQEQLENMQKMLSAFADVKKEV